MTEIEKDDEWIKEDILKEYKEYKQSGKKFEDIDLLTRICALRMTFVFLKEEYPKLKNYFDALENVLKECEITIDKIIP